MNKRKKELIIIIPMVALAILILITVILPYFIETPEIYVDNNCQEGWYKYETPTGTLCSKYPLSIEEVEKFE